MKRASFSSTLSCTPKCIRFLTIMAYKKLIFGMFIINFLGACSSPTAMLGPAYTLTSTGNVLQAGYSYGGNMAVREVTGKSPSQHVTSYVENQNEERKIKKIKDEMITYLEKHIDEMRIKTHLEKVKNKLALKK